MAGVCLQSFNTLKYYRAPKSLIILIFVLELANTKKINNNLFFKELKLSKISKQEWKLSDPLNIQKHLLIYVFIEEKVIRYINILIH